MEYVHEGMVRGSFRLASHAYGGGWLASVIGLEGGPDGEWCGVWQSRVHADRATAVRAAWLWLDRNVDRLCRPIVVRNGEIVN